MKSQNSKDQKSDFLAQKTLNLLKTDFSMRANSVEGTQIQNSGLIIIRFPIGCKQLRQNIYIT